MPWLTTEGSSHQIAEGETVVGSGADAGWRLAQYDLASRHFIVDRNGSRVTVRTCGVDNVIALNGVQSGAQAHDLKDGDVIDAGSGRFLFSSERSGSYPAVNVGPAHLIEARGGAAHELLAPSVGIGRDRLNAIVVRDPTASRFHAEIRREAGGYVLHPRGSSGTLVNGQRIGSPTRLSHGDRIEIGSMEMAFVTGPVPLGTRTAEPAPDDDSSRRPTVEESRPAEVGSERSNRAKWLLRIGILVLIAAVLLVVLTSR
jgi:pSer/pThr/pTyr-binding forkhead associated (FHA) protein